MGKAAVSHRTKFLYGTGAFGYGSVSQTLNSFMMFFASSILGIPGTLVGVAIGISTVWDATTDPFVGHFSDNTKSQRFGKRHGWILFASIGVATTNLILWSISPEWGTWTKFLMLLFLLLIIETFNTCYSTPYQALGIDLSANYQDRTAVQAYRTVFGFLALLVPTLLMRVFLSPERYVTMGASARGYQEIALVTSILCVVFALVCFLGTYKNRERHVLEKKESQEQGEGIISEFFKIIRQKNVGRLILGYGISLAAGAFITSLGLHVFTYTFQFNTAEIPYVMISLIAGIILAQPLWLAHSRKHDKPTSLVSALFIVILGMVVFGVLLTFRNVLSGEALLLMVCATIFICGLGTGCLYSLPVSMFADCIDKQERETGSDKTASSMGFLTFCTKVSNAFIMFVVGLSLDLIGFRGGEGSQSIWVQNWLGWVLILGVVVSATCAIFIYSGYTYGKKDFENSTEKG